MYPVANGLLHPVTAPAGVKSTQRGPLGDLLPVQYAHTPLKMLSLKRLGLSLPIMPPPSSGAVFDT